MATTLHPCIFAAAVVLKQFNFDLSAKLNVRQSSTFPTDTHISAANALPVCGATTMPAELILLTLLMT